MSSDMFICPRCHTATYVGLSGPTVRCPQCGWTMGQEDPMVEIWIAVIVVIVVIVVLAVLAILF